MCTATASVMITEPSEILVELESTIESCNGESDGTATVNVSGGTSPYTYEWSSSQNGPLGQTSMMVTGLTTGTYTVTVSDLDMCSKTAAVMVQIVLNI